MNALDVRQNEIREVFAEVTRYPSEILDPEANLEEDLGIDSVKLGEIFAVLRERYDLPEDLEIPPESLRTMAGMSAALHEYLEQRQNGGGGNGSGGNGDGAATVPASTIPEPSPVPSPTPPAASRSRSAASPPAASPPPSPAPPPAASPPSPSPPAAAGPASPPPGAEALGQEVREVFAEVTRYPSEILDPEARLEEDLGIDSVKLGEIFAVLRERYDLPEEVPIPPESLQTMGQISSALHEYLSSRSPAESTPPAAPAATEPAATEPPPTGSRADPVSGPSPIAGSFAALSPELRPFAGKTAFVSGSGRGLGKEIVSYLAGLGASVVVNSFHSRQRGEETAEEIRAAGGDATHLWGSVANPEQLHELFDRIEDSHGSLDFFISNASNGMLASIEDLTVEHWEKAFRTNVVGLHQGAVRAARLMKRNGGGKIITLSSPAAHGYVEYFGCMGPVKAAVESLTRALAVEFAPYNIQVNCVSPGPIDGELLRKWPESERLVAEWKEATPLSQLCEPRDVAHFIAYLLSDQVTAFTGSTLVVDAGISSRGW